MNKQLFIFISIFFLSITIFSQNTIIIKGIVHDKSGKAIENAQIAIENKASNEFNFLTQTAADGRFSISITKNEETLVYIVPDDYSISELHIPPLQEAPSVEFKIVVDKKETTLNTVVVEGKYVTTTTERIDYIAKNRAATPTIDGSIEGLLVTMGGVNSNNELSSQYSVRGGNFDENLVYVNGMQVFRPLLVRSAQQEGLSFINPRMIKTVNFSTGGYTAEYGDRMSSVLDVGYKRPEGFEGGFSASLLGGDVYVGSSSKRFSQVTGIRYKQTNTLLNTTDTKAEYNPSFIDAQTYMVYEFTPKWNASLLGNYSHNKYKFEPQSRSTSYGTLEQVQNFQVNFIGWEKDQFVTHQAVLSLKGKISDAVNLSFSGSVFGSNEYERYDIESNFELKELIVGDNGQTWYDDENSIGTGRYHEHARNRLKSNIYTFSHAGEARVGSNQLKWGLSYQQEKIDDKINEWERRDSLGYSLPNTEEALTLFYNLKSANKLNSSRYSAFVQDTYRLAANSGLYIFNLGARVSYWDYNKETIVSPRGSIAFIPATNDNFVIRLASGIYYQSPFYKEFQKIVANKNNPRNNFIELNKNIKSQKSVHVVLGADYHFKTKTNLPFKLTSEIYYKKLTDLIPYTINNVKLRYSGENNSHGYIAGMDLKLYGEFLPGLDSWISFSLMKSEQTINGIKVPMPTDQAYNFSIFFQDSFPGYDRLTVNLKGIFAQGLPTSIPHLSYEMSHFRLPAYKRVDLGFAWKALAEESSIRQRSSFWGAFKNIWLGVDLFNVFDMKNINTYYWIVDAYNYQHGVPNYLTSRQLNFKIITEF